MRHCRRPVLILTMLRCLFPFVSHRADAGSRGSSDMMEEFHKLADAGKMNADTLRSALSADYNCVHEKAMLPKAQPSGGQ